MKVAVITRHAVANYGSLLQAIATQRIIEELGHSCEFIDYIPRVESNCRLEKTLLHNKPNWNNNFIKKFIYLSLRFPESILSAWSFQKERKKLLHLSQRYTEYEQLVAEKPNADIYMTGSDQVWGPIADGTMDKAYCLAFTSDDDRRISYAASFGHTVLTERLADFYKQWIGRYSHVTVRESSARSMLDTLGIDSKQVLDPTLLLDGEQWRKYASKISPKRYVLVYQIHNNPRVNEYAKKVAKAKGIPLVRISPCFRQITRGGKFVWLPRIDKFLAYINGAECLITDSFHGTAFAINFNVPFVEVLTNNGTQSRNVSILELTRLTNRILQDDNDIHLTEVPIDYTTVNRILADKRCESIRILQSMLES